MTTDDTVTNEALQLCKCVSVRKGRREDAVAQH
jgi:hypothetical protein